MAPSILSADFGYLMRDIDNLKGTTEYLHLDVMDGHYVDNLSIGIPVIKSIRKHSDLIFDTHLMITNPEKYISAFAKAGSDMITFHIECTEEAQALIDSIRAEGCKAGIAIHPDTPIEVLLPWVDKCDLILIMSVRPGFGGQGYMDGSNERINAIRQAIDAKGADTILSVDGGINMNTIKGAYDAGARLLVAGNAVFAKEDPAQAVKELKACVTA
ncbi:MAG: ribulose-phosphate 3-epimerase [Saccharofermentans sp.]|nr:ribulose-phosphate 3-epimerase [Saccharofermentans sp.]